MKITSKQALVVCARAAALALSALATACVVQPQRAPEPAKAPPNSDYWNTVVEGWEGRNAIDLWREWGVPTNIVTAPNGNEMHIYLSSSKPGSGDAPVHLSHGMSTPSGTGSCETDFEVDAQKVIVNGIWRGESCPRSEKQELPKWIFIPTGF